MWQFLKRWRKAYLEDKMVREHAETRARCKTVKGSVSASNLHGYNQARNTANNNPYLRFVGNFFEAAHEVMEESQEEDLRGRRRY